ncbi:MAG: serine/threonine-protein kinase [Myxococcota bacterium]
MGDEADDIDDDGDGEFDSLLRKVAAVPDIGFDEQLEAGTLVGESFRIGEKIGAGGMGIVYLARDERLDREVAVKLPGAVRGTDTYQRLLREARALARVNHVNVLTVHEVGEWEDRLFIAMEYVDGGTLRDWLRERPRDAREIIDVHVSAARGLAAAHATGLVHRDFKPANVLIGSDGRVRVGDFGLAIDEQEARLRSTFPETEHGHAGAPSRDASEERLTQTGTLMGTVGYIAPEIYTGGVADARSDQFSFCISLWEALTGKRPFVGAEADVRAAVCERHEQELPGAGDLPRWLRPLLHRGLAVLPEDRFEGMDALIDRLERARRRPRRIVAAVATVATVGGVSWGVAAAGSEEPLCQGAAQRVEALWPATRRAAIHARIGEAEVAVAPIAADRFVEAMDEFAAAWGREHLRACEDTRVYGHQSERVLELRVACLERGWAQADSLLELVDQSQVEPAILLEARRFVPDLRPCGDFRALEKMSSGLSAESEFERQRLAIRLERAALNPSVLAGDRQRVDDALASLTEIAAEAKAAGFTRVSGEALLRRGELEVTFNTVTDGAKSYAECMQLGTATGFPQLFGHCAARLVALYPGSGMSREHAESTYNLAGAALEQITDQHDRALLTSMLGPAATSLGLVEDAIAYTQGAVEFFEQHVDATTTQLATARVNLGVALLEAERIIEAADVLNGALSTYIELYGEDSLAVARHRSRMAGAVLRAGRHEEGLEHALASVQAFERLGRAETLDYANALSIASTMYERLGKLDEALEAAEHALAIETKLLAGDVVNSGELIGNIALMHFRKGNGERAMDLAMESRERLVGVYGKSSLRVVQADTLLGGFSRRLGRLDEAITALQRAHDVCIELLGQQAGACINATVELATAQNAAGEHRPARNHAEEALRHTEAAGNPEYSAEAELALAKALAGLGQDPPRVRDLAQSARDRYLALGPAYAPQVAAIEGWLASQ